MIVALFLVCLWKILAGFEKSSRKNFCVPCDNVEAQQIAVHLLWLNIMTVNETYIKYPTVTIFHILAYFYL